ncbi:MAG TPA: ACP S-malonyltransferase [Candidatus Tripitaka californicus]|uniref:ACP S-malonyltransferase n=3 Tax=Candidatus Tripitaka californicus TaxID=3367616 RepID=UPI00402957B6|nr:ACP S-malonyltransferase [Planctomycetota bacterium]
MPLRAFLFPGQGAHRPGMGKDFYAGYQEARKVYQKANDVLGFDLAQLCFSGNEQELEKTVHNQPAILVTSIAILEVFRSLKAKSASCGLEAHATAGLSLGEYTALVFAGAIAFEDAVGLVYKRGKFMQEASEERPGGMVSIIGLSDGEVEALCKEASQYGIVCAANYNCPGQVVISGETRPLEVVSQEAKKRGAKRVIPLKVSGAFHSPLMASAQAKMASELQKVRIQRARTPVVSNIHARYVQEPEEIRSALLAQLTGPVRWTESMHNLLKDGVEEFYEVGPGKVIAGLIRRIDPNKTVKSLETVTSLEAVLP